jgi:hypothetical protein
MRRVSSEQTSCAAALPCPVGSSVAGPFAKRMRTPGASCVTATNRAFATGMTPTNFRPRNSRRYDRSPVGHCVNYNRHHDVKSHSGTRYALSPAVDLSGRTLF